MISAESQDAGPQLMELFDSDGAARRFGEQIVCDADTSTTKVSTIHAGDLTSFIIYET